MTLLPEQTQEYAPEQSQDNTICQKTLAAPCHLEGIGMHTGQILPLALLPGEANTGFLFERSDLPGSSPLVGRWDHVSDTRMCTQLTHPEGFSIGTVEHLLAALAAWEIDNAVIQIGGPEIPILDGSSQGFIEAIGTVGVVSQPSPRRFLKVLEKVEIREKDRFVSLAPGETPTFEYSIDFFGGRDGLLPQQKSFTWSVEGFQRDIGPARTFGFYDDAQKLQAAGLARGASLENAVVFHEGKVLNKDGLRFSDEPLRHKILDAVGDLILAGAPILGAYCSHNGGHELNNRLLHKLLTQKSAWTETTLCA